jgi:TonB family protein
MGVSRPLTSGLPIRNRSRPAALACTALLAFAARTPGETVSGPAAETGLQDQVPIEVFKEPRAKHLVAPDCELRESTRVADADACNQLRHGIEGWVTLGLMVDANGKPFEVTIIRSTGDKTFEQTAKKAVEHSIFEPGSLNGKPIESGTEVKYKFEDVPPSTGATRAFIDTYKSLMAAVDAGDRPAADTAMNKLRVTNLYEDAYAGIATYTYATKWGDVSQQLDGLRRAIAGENGPRYLPRDMFQAALLGCIKLELTAREYAEAMITWHRLEKMGIDAGTAAVLKPIIDKLEKIRSDATSYDVSGLMPEGTWHLHLFKRHFQAVVSEGYISQVKLRCDKRYVYFAFDPTLKYETADGTGKCAIELDGAPGTKFKLIQF